MELNRLNYLTEFKRVGSASDTPQQNVYLCVCFLRVATNLPRGNIEIRRIPAGKVWDLVYDWKNGATLSTRRLPPAPESYAEQHARARGS